MTIHTHCARQCQSTKNADHQDRSTKQVKNDRTGKHDCMNMNVVSVGFYYGRPQYFEASTIAMVINVQFHIQMPLFRFVGCDCWCFLRLMIRCNNSAVPKRKD